MAGILSVSRKAEWPRYFNLARDGETIALLDGLRAAAISLVLARHAIVPFRPRTEAGPAPMAEIIGWDPATPLINGWIGVDLFFVLSGFLISTGIINRQGAGAFRLGTYIWRRAMRIVPAYYAMIGVVALGLVPLYDVATDMLSLSILYHLLFLQDYLPSNLVVAFWSLGVEEKFYIAAPFVLIPLLGLRRRGAQYALILLLILTPLAFRLNVAAGGAAIDDYPTFFQTLRSPFHRGFDGLAVGVLVAFLWRDRDVFAALCRRQVATLILWAGIAVIAALWLRTPLLDEIDWFDRTLLQLMLAVGFGAILLGGLLRHASKTEGPVDRALAHPALQPWAVLSYSLYLVHMTTIPLSQAIASQIWHEAQARPVAAFAVFVPIYLAIAVLGALILHFTVEKPFLRLRDAGKGPD